MTRTDLPAQKDTRPLDKRRRNIRAALEKIIEKASEVEVNAAAVVSAVSACSNQ